MRYKAAYTDVTAPGIFSPEWDKASVGEISAQRWEEYNQPVKTTFKVLRDRDGISILMHCDEKNLRSECKTENGDIYLDSCMEFFYKPDPWNVNYFNFEFNPDKVLHLGFGQGRHGRVLIDADRDIFKAESVVEDGNWTLKFYIPDSFILEYVDNISHICKCNFYKCGDGTDHPHYIAWSEVEVDKPDFHVPDFFGTLEF